jgi:sigma-54 dependent transcriptional regulator, acetoin dehydrogenase operon transcriptional activator AcoR
MGSILKQIQDTVIKYAHIISQVINVDVEIVDKNLLRIAGTGIYEDKINEDITKEGMVYSHVLRTGEQHIIEEPGRYFLCEDCESKNNCMEKMQVCTPIRLGEEIIGVIGLVCSTYEQKDTLINNMKFYRPFLVQIADFISSKVYEHIEKERNSGMVHLLKQVIDSLDKGILVVNNDSEIVHMNQPAIRQLRLSEEYLYKHIEISACNETIAGEEVFTVKIEGRKQDFMGKLIPIFPSLPPYDKIFVFNEIKRNKVEGPSTYVWQTIRTEDIIAASRPMLQVKEKIKKVASSKSTVLISGESGTGKELIARAIHAESGRWNKPFIAINCGAIPDTLLESELFGYVRGAFSGADSNGRLGKFELANKGVIFLDEIGDMPLYLQVKILRVLQERKIVRIGSNQLIDLDIRVIAATNKNLKQMVEEGRFREDLYYRLNVIPIEVPPLRERGEDVKVMVLKMIERYKKISDKNIINIDEEAMKILSEYSWPGNVRELENVIEFMVNMVDERGILGKETLPSGILGGINKSRIIHNDLSEQAIEPLKEVEKRYILRALDLYGNDVKGKKEAAKHLGIGIATLYRKLEEIKEELSK